MVKFNSIKRIIHAWTSSQNFYLFLAISIVSMNGVIVIGCKHDAPKETNESIAQKIYSADSVEVLSKVFIPYTPDKKFKDYNNNFWFPDQMDNWYSKVESNANKFPFLKQKYDRLFAQMKQFPVFASRGGIFRDELTTEIDFEKTKGMIVPYGYYSENRNKFNGNEIFTMKKNGIVTIGMTKNMVKQTMGYPNATHKTETAYGVSEQWVYDNRYIYFENGVVSAIQN